MVTYCNQAYRSDHFEMCRNIKSACCVTGTNIVLEVSYTSKTNSQKKRSDLQLPEAGGLTEREHHEGCQKAKLTVTNNYQGCNVMINIMNTAVCCM